MTASELEDEGTPRGSILFEGIHNALPWRHVSDATESAKCDLSCVVYPAEETEAIMTLTRQC
jgi:hypothetical protein